MKDKNPKANEINEMRKKLLQEEQNEIDKILNSKPDKWQMINIAFTESLERLLNSLKPELALGVKIVCDSSATKKLLVYIPPMKEEVIC